MPPTCSALLHAVVALVLATPALPLRSAASATAPAGQARPGHAQGRLGVGVGVGVGVDVDVDWATFLARSDPVNSFDMARPATIPDVWLEGSFMGNGMIGAQVRAYTLTQSHRHALPGSSLLAAAARRPLPTSAAGSRVLESFSASTPTTLLLCGSSC